MVADKTQDEQEARLLRAKCQSELAPLQVALELAVQEAHQLLSHYTADSVQTSVAPQWDRYYAKLAIGQSPTWQCDQRTRELFVLSNWLHDELISLNCSQEDKVDVLNYFNRKARAENDLYQVAANAVNTFLDGKVEKVRRRSRR